MTKVRLRSGVIVEMPDTKAARVVRKGRGMFLHGNAITTAAIRPPNAALPRGQPREVR